jgi:hypothetical protein
MRGGMNRLLLRSNASDSHEWRVEVLFMNVKYMCIGTSMNGLIVTDGGPIDEKAAASYWRLSGSGDLRRYELESGSGNGVVVAGSVTVDISDASPSDPSKFFMM